MPVKGDTVLFYPDKNSTPWVAIIVTVWSDTCVNIATWDGNGRPVNQPMTSLPFVSRFEDAPFPGPFVCPR